MAVFSMMGILGEPYQFVIRVYLEIYIFLKSLESYYDFMTMDYSEQDEHRVVWYLIFFNLWHLLFTSLMNATAWIPLLGPFLNIVTVLSAWAYTDIESQQTDKNNYYG